MRQIIFQRLLAITYILGPLFLLTSGIIWLLGIGLNPGVMNWGSYIEGFIGYFGFILLVPVFISLAFYLGGFMPKFGAIIAIIALLGFAGGGVMNMVLRVVIYEFVTAGVSNDVLEQLMINIEGGETLTIFMILTGPLGPISSILLGIGFILNKVIRFNAIFLIVGGLLLMTGQLLMISPEITYTMAITFWTLALVPLGVKMLSKGNVIL